jgi:hypothetical protein
MQEFIFSKSDEDEEIKFIERMIDEQSFEYIS